MQKGGSRSDSGFTLIEMMAALLIMMVGLLGLLQAVIVALEYDTRNVLREESVHLAEEEMNKLRLAAAHEDLSVFRGAAFGDPAKSSLTAPVTVQIRGGTRLFTVTREYEPAGHNSRRLWVRVSYDYRGDTLQHEIYTVKSSR